MTTDNAIFEYRYDIIEMIPLPGDMIFLVITIKDGSKWSGRAIALAKVRIVKFNKIKRFESESHQVLRYVVLDRENRPYVSYEEDTDEEFIEIQTEETK